MSTFLACAMLTAALPIAQATAQKPVQDAKSISKQQQVTATATITAIDPATRSVTIRDEGGVVDTFTVSPIVTRFDQLKVGDTIKATYYESLVLQLRRPGAPAPTTGQAAAARLKDVPGGVAARETTMTVTVKAIDTVAPSITVVTESGVTLTRKVADRKNLEGVSPGDKIDITFTQGIVVSAEPAKK